MTGAPKSPPTLTSNASTGGTPGTFKGKSYRVGKAEIKANIAKSPKIAELMKRFGVSSLNNKAEMAEMLSRLQANLLASDPVVRRQAFTTENEVLIAEYKAQAEAFNLLQSGGYKPAKNSAPLILKPIEVPRVGQTK